MSFWRYSCRDLIIWITSAWKPSTNVLRQDWPTGERSLPLSIGATGSYSGCSIIIGPSPPLSQSNICQAVLCLLPELDQDSLREVQCKIGELLREWARAAMAVLKLLHTVYSSALYIHHHNNVQVYTMSCINFIHSYNIRDHAGSINSALCVAPQHLPSSPPPPIPSP